MADLLLTGFTIEWSKWWGFVLCVLIFTVLQSLLAPWITSMANRYAPALLGGIGIISTFVALLIVVLLPVGGLRITDALAWILGPVVVWIITVLCTMLLPLRAQRRSHSVCLRQTAGEQRLRQRFDTNRRGLWRTGEAYSWFAPESWDAIARLSPAGTAALLHGS